LLLKTARDVDDIETLASGNPKRIERRVKNKLLGRAPRRRDFWLWLWRYPNRGDRSGSCGHDSQTLVMAHSRVVLHVVIGLKIRANLGAPGASTLRMELKNASTDMFG
jgi:hypothetical protein